MFRVPGDWKCPPLGRVFRIVAIICLLSLAEVIARSAADSGASVDPTDDSLRLYAAAVEHSPPQSWIEYITHVAKRVVKIALRRQLGAAGIYLGSGWVLTAAHVV